MKLLLKEIKINAKNLLIILNIEMIIFFMFVIKMLVLKIFQKLNLNQMN